MKIVGAVVRTGQTFIKVREVGAAENVLVFGRGNSHLTVGKTYQFSHLMDGEKLFKSYKTTSDTQVTQLGQQKNQSDALGQGSVKDKFNHKTSLGNKLKEDVEDEEKNILRPQSQFSTAQAKVMKRLNSGQPKTSKEQRPKGKTYRRTKYSPSEVSMQDPKTKKKLDDWHRRDTKSGGLSWSSRMRLDPSRIRLGSDRFSRPRSDRIYNVEDSDTEEL